MISGYRLNGLVANTVTLLALNAMIIGGYHRVDLAEVSIFTTDEFVGVMLQLYFGKPIKR